MASGRKYILILFRQMLSFIHIRSAVSKVKHTIDRQTDTLHYAFILQNVILQSNVNMSVIDAIEPSLSRAKVVFFVEDYAACSHIECSGQFLFSRARAMVERDCN